MSDDPPEVPLLRELRHALQDLYDPGRLRASSLCPALGLGQQEAAGALRRILTQAIEELEPEASASPHSAAWRTYRVLSHRYIDQFSQQEVASTLGLSIRQMRRQERLALQVLADHLASHYDLQPEALARAGELPPPGQPPLEDAEASARDRELERLRTFPNETAAAADIISPLLKVVTPLTRSLHVHVECALPEGLPRLTAQTAALRQALLNLFTAAIHAAPGGRVVVSAQTEGGQVGIRIMPVGLDLAAATISGGQLENLEMARQLATIAGGSLAVLPGEAAGQPFVATLRLPVAEEAVILFIDDNADTLELYQRYLSGSRYPFAGVREPQQALALAQELAPKAIVLDVMLPGVDGWELLGRLLEHPRTRNIPVIVSTILPQEQLALSLGAAALLRKPVSREGLLAALDQFLGPPSPGCR